MARGLAAAKASGRSLAELTRADFPLPVLGDAIAGWLLELQRGRGFLNVKGIPVERLSQADAELCTWGIGLHMERAVSQNAAGDLLGHVRDLGADPSDPSLRLEPGEINFLKNDTALHARTECVDHAAPERKRHLLRLWLTAHDELAESDAFPQQGIPKKSGVASDADAP